MANNVVFPDVEAATIVLADLPDKRVVRVAVARRAFILRRDQDGVDVWPGVCPHEGAELNVEHLDDKLVVCPWHGLKHGAQAHTLKDARSSFAVRGSSWKAVWYR